MDCYHIPVITNINHEPQIELVYRFNSLFVTWTQTSYSDAKLIPMAKDWIENCMLIKKIDFYYLQLLC